MYAWEMIVMILRATLKYLVEVVGGRFVRLNINPTRDI